MMVIFNSRLEVKSCRENPASHSSSLNLDATRKGVSGAGFSYQKETEVFSDVELTPYTPKGHLGIL